MYIFSYNIHCTLNYMLISKFKILQQNNMKIKK